MTKKSRPQWLDELQKEYEERIAYMRKQNKAVSETMWKRLKMCRDGDVAALKAESCFLVPDQRRVTIQRTGENQMKKTKEKKITAGKVLAGIFGRAKVPGDAAVIAEVKSATGSTLFGAKQLAWYRWKLGLSKPKKRIVVKKKK